MTETRLYYCQGCNDHKPGAEFEFYSDKNGRRAPRKSCRVCNGSLGHKVCAECKVDKPIDKFKIDRKPGRNFEITYNRNCWACIYARRKAVGPPRSRETRRERYSERNPEIAPRRRSNGELPVGWTPPPTLERLAEIHARHRPPAWWTPVRGERSA